MTLNIKKIDKISTFIGQDTEFEGKLKFRGAIRIDGHFKGEISGEGTLIVGEGATIDSDIHVSQILNSGEIQGNVNTDKGIEVTASGNSFGIPPFYDEAPTVSDRGSRSRDRGDRDLPGRPLPHHRTCGSASGGSVD